MLFSYVQGCNAEDFNTVTYGILYMLKAVKSLDERT